MNRSPTRCTDVWRRTYGKFKNGVFCASVDTWTELSAKYRVYNFGATQHASWTGRKWGGCTALLHFEETIVHPS